MVHFQSALFAVRARINNNFMLLLARPYARRAGPRRPGAL